MFLVRSPVGAWPGFGTQPCYKVLGDLWVKIVKTQWLTLSEWGNVQNSPWQLTNVEAFAKAYQFFSICLGKNNAEAIEFLGILKKYVSKNKIYFCLKKKRSVLLNKKVIFVFHMIFKLDFIMQIIYCIIDRMSDSLFIFIFVLLCYFLRNGPYKQC